MFLEVQLSVRLSDQTYLDQTARSHGIDELLTERQQRRKMRFDDLSKSDVEAWPTRPDEALAFLERIRKASRFILETAVSSGTN